MTINAKVVLVGDASVGKTSILLAAGNQSTQYVTPTVSGAGIPLQVSHDGLAITLTVWDTAGQEVYRPFVPMFARGAEVGVIVFDLNRLDTFNSVDDWTAIFADLPVGQCQLVVVGNKSDILPWAVPKDDIQRYCESQRFPYYLTSATTRDGIDVLMAAIAGMVADKHLTGRKKSDAIGINLQQPKAQKTDCC
jgi:small GTP-binding protein